MKKIGKFIFFVFIFYSTQLLAQDFQVEAQVDRDQMGIGDSFNLSLRITGNDDFEIEAPQISSVAGLELLNSWAGGRQSSSSMTMMNGKAEFTKSVSQTFNYQYSPQKEGAFLIPVIDVKINGQIYKSNPIKIEVAEKFRNTARAKNKKSLSRPQFPPGFGDDEETSPFGSENEVEDLFSQLMKQRQRMFGQLPNQGRGFGVGQGQDIKNRKLDVDMNEAYFVWLDIDKTEVYEGEQVTANWFIYTRGNLESLDRVKFPDLKGFWKEILEEVPSLQFIPEMVNGVLYNKALLASHALFPIKPGQAVIDEFKVKGRVRNQTQFGWGSPREYTKTSKRTMIKVLPLPTEGKTIHFSGAVGSYQVSVKTEGNSFPAHQPFSVKVRFEGIGNAKLIDLPNIQWPDGLEVFDTKNESKFFKDGQSYKEFEILAIPRKEGELKIPSLSFSYFDPTQKKYVTQSTEEIKLMITPGSAQSSKTSSANQASTEIKETEYSAQPILELPSSSFSFAKSRVYFYLALALFIFLATTFSYLRKLKNFQQAPGFRKSIEVKLNLIADQKDQRKIAAESLNLIYLLAAYLAGQNKANQEWSELIKEIPLKSQSLYLERMTKLFDYFQLLGFSPEDVVTQLLKTHAISDQVAQLKKIAEEISAQAKTEDEA